MSYRVFVLLAVILLAFTVPATALTPHDEFKDETIENCNMCHDDEGIAPNHTAFWVQEHRLSADKESANCISCHEQSYCTDCHFGGGITTDLHKSQSGADYMPRSHRTDFLEIHPIKAWSDPASCARCHDAKSFCSDCHAKFNNNDLRLQSHRKGWSDTQVQAGGAKHSSFASNQCAQCHPNSVLPSNRWTSLHSREARKNLATCQTCHPEGEVCMQCHSATTGLKASPHPAGWGDIKGRLEKTGNRKSCNKCH